MKNWKQSSANRWRKRFKPDSNESIESAVQYVSLGNGDDNADYDPPFRGFIVGVAGNVSVQGPEDESPVTLPNMVAGVIHSCAFTKLRATGTTATTIVGVR